MVPGMLGMIVAGAVALTAVQAVAADGKDRLSRGRYLVERVGMCDDCHTPRNAMGQPDISKRMHGANIDFQPVMAMPVWAGEAPSLAGGRPGWSRAQMVEFLSSGIRPGGANARPPMPFYRLSRPDAEAVAAYLESLPAPDAVVKARAR